MKKKEKKSAQIFMSGMALKLLLEFDTNNY